MDLTTITSSDCMDKLKCTSCTHYLSYFPIFLTVDNGTVCGRCATPGKDGYYLRNISYETVVQFLRFPCKFQVQGCRHEIFPKDVPHHESTCQHRVTSCPLMSTTSCKWQDSHMNLVEHCREQHKNIILDNGQFEMGLSQGYDCCNLIHLNERLFLVRRKFHVETKMLSCAVCLLPCELTSNNYSCQLTMRDCNKTLSVEFKTTNPEDMCFTDLFLESIQNHRDDPSVVFGKLSIGKEMILNGQLSHKSNILQMLSVLKCSVCNCYIMPPVYSCTCKSINLCSQCQQQHLCSSIGRNINLDKIASLLDYPCKYQDNGCDFWAKPDQMIIHQGVCELKSSGCLVTDLVSCSWKGLAKNVTSHITIKHGSLISNTSEFCIKVGPDTFFTLLSFSGHLFRLFYANREAHHYWTVQAIGCNPDYFKYQIEMYDDNNGNRRFCIQQPCTGFVWRKKIFKSSDSLCCFSDNFLIPYITNGSIRFKVHISKC